MTDYQTEYERLKQAWIKFNWEIQQKIAPFFPDYFPLYQDCPEVCGPVEENNTYRLTFDYFTEDMIDMLIGEMKELQEDVKYYKTLHS